MVDVKSALKVRLRATGDRVLKPLRRGRRLVQIVPEHGAGFGNQSYIWLNAFLRQQDGQNYRVLAPATVDGWMSQFPLIREKLCLAPNQLRLLDDRTPWTFRLYDSFGQDFTRMQLHAFIREFMLPTLAPRISDSSRLVINVRRGDYYSNPIFRQRYGFNFQSYLRVALEHATQGTEEFSQVMVISDDVSWCRRNLTEDLRRWSPSVTYISPDATPQDHFRALAGASRIIGSNSTFSYWAGYVSNVLHGADSQVIVPKFHDRLRQGSDAYQIDPEWNIIQDIPGGWGP